MNISVKRERNESARRNNLESRFFFPRSFFFFSNDRLFNASRDVEPEKQKIRVGVFFFFEAGNEYGCVVIPPPLPPQLCSRSPRPSQGHRWKCECTYGATAGPYFKRFTSALLQPRQSRRPGRSITAAALIKRRPDVDGRE